MELDNIVLEGISRCEDEKTSVPLEQEGSVQTVEEALRQHLLIYIPQLIDTIHRRTPRVPYTILLGGGRAAEFYLNPSLLELARQQGLYRFTYDFDLLIWSDSPDEIYSPQGKGYTDHPAQLALQSEIHALYQDDFLRREVLSRVATVTSVRQYDLQRLDRSLKDGSAFLLDSWIPAREPGQRLWQIKIQLPLRGGGSDLHELLDLKNLYKRHLEEYSNPDLVVYRSPGSVGLKFLPKNLLFGRTLSDLNTLSTFTVPYRKDMQVFVVESDALYREQALFIGDEEEARSLIGSQYDAIVNFVYTTLGTLTAWPFQTMVPFYKQSLTASLTTQSLQKYTQRLFRTLCLYYLYVEKGPHGRTFYTPSKFASLFPLATYTDPATQHTPNEYVTLESSFPYLKSLMNANQIVWYTLDRKSETLTTKRVLMDSAVLKFNSHLQQTARICRNERALSMYPSFQDTIDTYIQIEEDKLKTLHADIFLRLEAALYNRATFLTILKSDTTPFARLVWNLVEFAHDLPPLYFDQTVTITTRRFGFPMPVLFTKMEGTTMGIVDSLPINQVVYTAANLSTSRANSGFFNLASFRNVFRTGFTLYEFELQRTGFVYFTYESKKSEPYANEYEVFLPCFTKFYVKAKQWKYVATLSSESADDPTNYTLAFVVTLAQIPETKEQYMQDINVSLSVVGQPPPPSIGDSPIGAGAGPASYASQHPSDNLPAGFDYKDAATVTGIPFETPYSPTLQVRWHPDDPTGFKWDNVDQWIVDHFPTTETEWTATEPLVDVLDFAPAVNGDKAPFPKQYSPNAITIPAHDSSLIHAMLHCISRRFRYHPQKRAIARAVRQHLLIKSAAVYSDLTRLMGPSNLEGEDFQFIQSLFQVNILIHHIENGQFFTNYERALTPVGDKFTHKFSDQPTIVLLLERSDVWHACLYQSYLLSADEFKSLLETYFFNTKTSYIYPVSNKTTSPVPFSAPAPPPPPAPAPPPPPPPAPAPAAEAAPASGPATATATIGPGHAFFREELPRVADETIGILRYANVSGHDKYTPVFLEKNPGTLFDYSIYLKPGLKVGTLWILYTATNPDVPPPDANAQYEDRPAGRWYWCRLNPTAFGELMREDFGFDTETDARTLLEAEFPSPQGGRQVKRKTRKALRRSSKSTRKAHA